jgi:SAM-dependent methyltransferase
MMFGFRDEFNYYECSKCGCVQIDEVPANLPRYYPQNYYSFQTDGAFKKFLKVRWAEYSFSGGSWIGSMMAAFMGKHQGVESVSRTKVARDAAILDVGCGSGDLLKLLHSLGFTNLTGADPFIRAEIRYPSGIVVLKKHLTEISQTFDLIMLHHSFEHMTNPAEIIAQAKRLLKPGGTLIIRVPIAASYAWKHYRANWVQLDPPRHIFLPSVTSIQILAERAGLRFGPVVHESNEFQFWGSEQYLKDTPLMDPRSVAPLWKQALARRKMLAYRKRAEELNAKGEGDSACFHLHNEL